MGGGGGAVADWTKAMLLCEKMKENKRFQVCPLGQGNLEIN